MQTKSYVQKKRKNEKEYKRWKTFRRYMCLTIFGEHKNPNNFILSIYYTLIVQACIKVQIRRKCFLNSSQSLNKIRPLVNVS